VTPERPLFSADSVGKRFGDRTVLRAASVWGWPGCVTALFGRNGCGKSTLLRIGAGLMAADQGVVHLDGRAYLRPRLHQLARRGLFYLPDRGLLSPRSTVGEHLRAVRWRFAPPAEPFPEALEVAPLLDRLPGTLSGGERHRAEIAVAWARNPHCLLADEPFAGISPADAERIGAALRALARRGCALVVTGHEVPQLMETADEVVWMTAGTTHGVGSPAAALAHEQFGREYLGMGHRSSVRELRSPITDNRSGRPTPPFTPA
jgi:lipopolysaccharide export system ATP-binding protein